MRFHKYLKNLKKSVKMMIKYNIFIHIINFFRWIFFKGSKIQKIKVTGELGEIWT